MKQTLYIAFLLCLSLFTSGCQMEEKSPVEIPSPSPVVKIETITIYSINSDTMSLTPVSVRKSNGGQLTAQSITNLVLSGLNDEQIVIDEVIAKGNKVIVSFSSKGKPVKNCSAQMENLILECFSNSLLDNVKDCEKVIFRSDGKEYKSSQYNFTINEVYASE